MCTKATVAIVGSGISGLLAAKSALEQQLEPTVFEKTDAIGGMWNPKSHLVYDSMRTNLSKHTCSFSDFIWTEDTSLFPNQKEVYDYLLRYKNHFNVQVKYNSTVTNISRVHQQWQIEWIANENKHSQLFDFVIIATGFFNSRYIPPIEGLDTFTGRVLHSSEYRNSKSFENRKVVVVGSSFSAVEIAAELANVSNVTNVITKPFWVIPRLIPTNPPLLNTTAPLDMVFCRHSMRTADEETTILSSEKNMARNNYFRSICGEYPFTPAVDSTDPAFLAISDTYPKHVETGNISLVKGRVTSVSGSNVVIDNDTTITNVQDVILCTGFKPTLPFLSKEILETLSFDSNETFCPMLLYKNMIHPELPGMGFVGMYRGPYFGVMELQARYITSLFSGAVEPLSEEELRNGIEEERKIRDQVPRPAFPHSDYVGLLNSHATLLKCLKPKEWRLAHNFVVPGQYRDSVEATKSVETADQAHDKIFNMENHINKSLS